MNYGFVQYANCMYCSAAIYTEELWLEHLQTPAHLASMQLALKALNLECLGTVLVDRASPAVEPDTSTDQRNLAGASSAIEHNVPLAGAALASEHNLSLDQVASYYGRLFCREPSPPRRIFRISQDSPTL